MESCGALWLQLRTSVHEPGGLGDFCVGTGGPSPGTRELLHLMLFVATVGGF